VEEDDTNRDAKYRAIIYSRERALARETERWRRLATVVEKLLWEAS